MRPRFARICPMLLAVSLVALPAPLPAWCQAPAPNPTVRPALLPAKAELAPPPPSPPSPQAAPADHRRRNAIIVAAAAAVGLLIVFFSFHGRKQCPNGCALPSMRAPFASAGPG